MASVIDELRLNGEDRIDFRLDLRCQLDTSEVNDCLTWFEGSIMGFDRTTHAELTLGRVSVFVLGDLGYPPLEALDSDCETVDYLDLFDPDRNELTPEVHRSLRGGYLQRGQSFLGVHQLALVPAVRGNGFGLHVLDRIVQRMGSGCGIAFLKPFPLQFGSLADSNKDWVMQLDLQRFNVGQDEGVAKLTAYYKRLDFVRVKGTSLMVRDLAYDPTYKLPALNAALVSRRLRDQ